jgi:hypothetical protein
MSTIFRPAGPQPARVYWIRRAVVIGALLLVVLLLWTMFAGGGGGGDAAADDAGDTGGDVAATNPPTEGQTDDADAARTGTAAHLTLVVTADAASYPAGTNPTFSVRITNTGDSSCTVDAGEANRELLVTSGSDRIWSSLDCLADGAAERVLLLPAGASDDPVAVVWQRVRSDEACGEGLPAPRAGTYHVVAKLVGAESQPATFSLG